MARRAKGAIVVIRGLFDGGSMPALERMIQFASLRHQSLAHNIANIDTPNFQPTDVPVDGFRAALARAIDSSRAATGGPFGRLEFRDTPELDFTPTGLDASLHGRRQNILFHDRNNRSLEHLMKDLAENTMTHNTAMEMLKGKFELLQTAIRERL
jgi:flagellar basal-body rod protein FlgB